MSVKVITKEESLAYHQFPNPGKIAIKTTKPCTTQLDLSYAYSPGVAYPCKAIEADPTMAYHYTSKGNLIAIITNSTAVLGLGNIGALAGKPVMEGKAVLFKRFADIDVFDLEINETDPDKFCEIVEKISLSFGGINLEDIKAPECFDIEQRIKSNTDIPVMHDDQHGTAIVVGAALLNALELVGKNITKVNITILGAGAAAIACAKMIKNLGVQNIRIFDSKGLIHTNRVDINKHKRPFAVDGESLNLDAVMSETDVFLGLSRSDIIDEAMIKSMPKNPIIFAMANPIPEIRPEIVHNIRNDAVVATGRSDYPNQINNVLAFPFIFRGALDTRAEFINLEMKMAAVKALARLARDQTPETVTKIYGNDLKFGKDYLIPTPFDPRLLTEVSTEVAIASMKSGSSKLEVDQFNSDSYKYKLRSRMLQ